MSILPFPRGSGVSSLTPSLLTDHVPTVAEVIASYLAACLLRLQCGALAAETLAKRKLYLDDFAAKYGPRSVNQCRAEDLVQWLLSHPDWRSSHTKADAVGVIIACFDWAAGAGQWLMRSPYERPRGLWKPPRPRSHATPEEYLALMQAARPAPSKVHRKRRTRGTCLRLALFFALCTGARTKEVRELRWSQIDWQRGIAVLSQHKTEAKTGKPRLLALGRARRLLQWLWRHRPDAVDGCVFVNSRGEPWTKNSFARAFAKFARLAKLRPELKPYSLRHTFCVEALKQLGDRQIADLMGHSSTQYIGWYGSEARDDAAYLTELAEQLTPPRARRQAHLFDQVEDDAELVELLRRTLERLQGGGKKPRRR